MFLHSQQQDPNDAKYLNALQQTVIEQRQEALQRDSVRLAKQRAFLREERRNARLEEAAINEESINLDHVKKFDWWPENHLKGTGNNLKRLKLRIGGQYFEASKEILCQDKDSLLFALCQEGSPAFESGKQETVVIDRDWWLFRLILNFLRDGLVPDDRSTALQLYREAAFWRLGSLQRAIEEIHLNLQRNDIQFEDGILSTSKMKDKEKFWKQRNNWWEATPPPKKDKPKPKKDWWLDGGGETEEKEVQDVHLSTWGYGHSRR
mmetsp:Transcript_3936/g.5193  ORF Transcript_3936/g.5193 Transcript_3936/m.5193 type:complete len:264 (+) Transcript_3936:21-812(+)|eukprot:CAMPEP_0114389922 /NCGR_PEP_ID=MMETSP0102-20121206/8997_1 /TAXON_ID=38822 ORGANISM="Pteridomonas danica, Strain PT" /NCGR_SAMPLE_ID=MMETSP0102 /ASSEMBLY_ACC=CAM_ASM_000212 /LENGTH=263 /DNA_ID=CAMNT_0001548015 /DNA_START=15 /DNA_END=806 /DNA_ORIENTATION=+